MFLQNFIFFHKPIWDLNGALNWKSSELFKKPYTYRSNQKLLVSFRLRADPPGGSAHGHTQAALLLLESMAHLDESERRFRQALEVRPDHVEANRGLAMLLAVRVCGAW